MNYWFQLCLSYEMMVVLESFYRIQQTIKNIYKYFTKKLHFNNFNLNTSIKCCGNC